jgi:hypothetical protein
MTLCLGGALVQRFFPVGEQENNRLPQVGGLLREFLNKPFQNFQLVADCSPTDFYHKFLEVGAH